ncbi:uncharacterized protein AB675_10842 [Cyphellophora attinorum]|uniref:Uncharacterized protein n=1 Tax=Cyphellophora attinorum TaxID=1664694 RepID=A0A0N1P0X4_9EURO|nr:uncharacterized protein AB675_10842 [Phialophora attinorum]KPI40780.1 hypothetical protein AB675_10842 [Phialophora attinorum]
MSVTPAQHSEPSTTASSPLTPPTLLTLPPEILNMVYALCMKDLIVDLHRHDVTNELHIAHSQLRHIPYGLPGVNKKLRKDFLKLLAKSMPLHIEKPSLLVMRNYIDPIIPKRYADKLQTLIISCSAKLPVQTVRIALFPNLKTLLFSSTSTAPLRQFLDAEVKNITQGWTKAHINVNCTERVTDYMRDRADFLLDQLQVHRALHPACLVKHDMQFDTFEATVLSPRKYLKAPTFTATITRSAGGDWGTATIEYSKAFETWDTMIASGEKGAVWGWLID